MDQFFPEWMSNDGGHWLGQFGMGACNIWRPAGFSPWATAIRAIYKKLSLGKCQDSQEHGNPRGGHD